MPLSFTFSNNLKDIGERAFYDCSGIKSIEEVEYAILEISGKLSVYKYGDTNYFPIPIIVSGKVSKIGLNGINKDMTWVYEEMEIISLPSTLITTNNDVSIKISDGKNEITLFVSKHISSEIKEQIFNVNLQVGDKIDISDSYNDFGYKMPGAKDSIIEDVASTMSNLIRQNKYDEAIKLGIEIWNEEEFLKNGGKL